MATTYLHGAYGTLKDSIFQPITQSGTIAVYVGTAPVNLVRGYAEYVNAPVKLDNLNQARRYFGDSTDWETFTLCEAFKAHFNNPDGNVGPIIVINVLDPATHKKAQATTTQLTFANKKATITSDKIILDTFAIADKVEGADYTLDYDYTKQQVIINDISSAGISGQVQATYNEVDTTNLDKDDIIGGVTAGGVYTGLGCVQLVYQELNWIPNIIAAPGWSHDKDVYDAMITAGMQINGHWDAYVVADLPIEDCDTIEDVKTFQTANGFTNERSDVCWPMGMDSSGNIYHLSTATVWQMLLTDATHDGVPFESPSNKETFLVKQYFGESSTNRGFDQSRANELNESGITTIVYWGARWVLWGPHTADYKFGAVTDPRSVFDVSMRMLFYLTNGFQQRHALQIDEPMTRALKDTILNTEQQELDSLVAMGALIGTPVIVFDETNNSTAEMIEGNFYWDIQSTPTPPAKSLNAGVAYTDQGFSSYFESGV